MTDWKCANCGSDKKGMYGKLCDRCYRQNREKTMPVEMKKARLEKIKIWQSKNKDKLKERQKAWRKANPEKLNLIRATYYVKRLNAEQKKKLLEGG